ncbi:MAG TPA: tetratricopeptide repeat protein [Candidatus Saccharimonadales bacterium]|nr:tetratricopeptide repeat protein [Candidatus Saccharimonadales bacterium]
MRLLLLASVFCVYWPTLRAGFVTWDDGLNIVHNPHLGFSLDKIQWMFTDCTYVRRYMPLGWLSYSIDRQFFAGAPLSCHFGNVLLHAINAMLLLEIIQSFFLIRLPHVEKNSISFASCLGALSWALNPLRTEPVAWASGRIYGVATLFFFLSVYLYLQHGKIAGSRRFVWLSALFFSLSLFTYPIALGGLAVFILLDIFVLNRIPQNPRLWFQAENAKVLLEKMAFLLPLAISFGVNLWGRLNHAWEPVISYADFSFPARLMQAFWVWSWYLWKPWLPLNLAPRYPDLMGNAPFTAAHISAALLLLALAALLVLRRKNSPALLFAWLCHMALISPFIGFTEHPHHTFDRYSHIAGIVWAAILAGVLIQARANQRLHSIILRGALLGCVLLGFLAHTQTVVWNNSLNLHSAMAHSLGRDPERATHEVMSAFILLSENRPAEAEARLRLAIEVNPRMAEAWAALGDALSDQKQTEEAISSFKHALELKADLNAARQNLGVTLAMAGRHEEAIGEFQTILRNKPDSAATHRNLAVSLQHLGRLEDSKRHMQEFRRLHDADTKGSS